MDLMEMREGPSMPEVRAARGWGRERSVGHEPGLSREILDSLDSQVAVLNADGEIVLVNRAWGKELS
jgi:PAS domain-containing protein